MRLLSPGFMRMTREGLMVTRDVFGWNVLCHFPHDDATDRVKSALQDDIGQLKLNYTHGS